MSMNSFDPQTLRAAFSGPGSDTRQWVSFGTVDEDAEGARSVVFDDEEGNPLPFPIVKVTLQPSGITVACRVASFVAGNGEGEWFPFISRDEVIVLVPEGDEKAGCTIVGRLNNGIDAWPRLVAGQDSTKNTFGFLRLRTPYIIETASSYQVRSASTGAGFAITQEGNLIIASGDGHQLILNADFLSLATGDGSTFVQIDPETKEVYLGADTATFLLSASGSKFLSSGTLEIVATRGTSAAVHAIGLEQVIALLGGIGTISPGPITGAGLLATLSAAIAAAAIFPITPYIPAITAGLIASLPDPTGNIPGIGRAGFLY